MVIDSSLFIEHLRAKDRAKTTLFQLPKTVPLFVSTVTVFELFSGATNVNKLAEVELILSGVSLLPFLDDEARKATEIFRHLQATGQIIEFRDIFIAATALVHLMPVKTLNVRHFSRVPGLVLA
ncbi:MAG: type II toxin-antitoxin system VapC family toxin [Saprospiraceae bacterium]